MEIEGRHATHGFSTSSIPRSSRGFGLVNDSRCFALDCPNEITRTAAEEDEAQSELIGVKRREYLVSRLRWHLIDRGAANFTINCDK
jgi:hypothetical protein